MIVREALVAPKVASVIDLLYFTKPIYLSYFTENSVSITNPNRLILFKKDMQPIKTMSGQTIHIVYA
jgi:hypothetical protein